MNQAKNHTSLLCSPQHESWDTSTSPFPEWKETQSQTLSPTVSKRQSTHSCHSLTSPRFVPILPKLPLHLQHIGPVHPTLHQQLISHHSALPWKNSSLFIIHFAYEFYVFLANPTLLMNLSFGVASTWRAYSKTTRAHTQNALYAVNSSRSWISYEVRENGKQS